MSTRKMVDSCEILALIPARGGSKGIAGKNLRRLGGVSLVGRAVRRARSSSRIGRVVVSTDSPEIADEARRHGAEVPFLRPAALAGDGTPMVDVVVHAYRAACDGGRRPGAVALLQPTSPFLRSETVDGGIDRFLASGARILKAVKRVQEHPAWMLVPRGERLEPYLDGPVLRRQDLPDLFIPCGALYVYRADWIEDPAPREPIAWIEVGWPESIDIDDPIDLEIAEWIVGKGLAGRDG